MDMLTLSHVSKRFGANQVIDDLNFKVPAHSIYGFIGQNGAGKTTTMKMILGLLKADSGDIFVNGEKVCYGQNRTNRYIGYLPDVPEFYSYMAPMEYLALCGEITGMKKTLIRKRSMELLELVGLEKSDKRIQGFSRGMKQRLGIAIALIGNPKFLILDEPINGLDPYGIEEMRDLFKNIVKNSNTSILISSHILDEIEKISSHIGILKNGVLTYSGSLKEYRDLHPPVIVLKTSDNLKASKLLELPQGNILDDYLVLGNKSQEEVAKIIKILVNTVDIYRVEKRKESLEKLFIQETSAR